MAAFASLAAHARDIKATKSAGGYRIELNVLSAEPFAGAGMAMGGSMSAHTGMMMVVKGGAAPVEADAASHPNHHLVVHVYDRASGKAAANAEVTITYVPLDKGGRAAGPQMSVPVVVMEAIGKGPGSTHYGNNVTMSPGAYRVDVTVNGTKVSFSIKL